MPSDPVTTPANPDPESAPPTVSPTVSPTWALASAAAAAVAGSSALATLATSLFGKALTVYLDGIPADRERFHDSLPALIVTPTENGHPQGGPVSHTVRALLLADASAGSATAGVPAQRQDGVRVLPGGRELSTLASAIRDLLRDPATAIGSRVVDDSCELDLVSSWPLRSADLSITFEDILAYA